MVFCKNCDTNVGSEEAPTLRLYGKCTRCHIRSLPPPTSPQIGVPPAAVQHAVTDLRERHDGGVGVLVH